MLIANIIDKQKENLHFLGKTDKNLDLISRMITELKRNNITEEALNNSINDIDNKYIKLKLEDINLLYNEFNKTISEKFLDNDDLLTIVKDKISKSNMFNNSYIFIDEFSGFTKQEYSVIEELLKIANEVNITICTDTLDKSNENDVFIENKNTVEKLKKIAEKININIEEAVELKERLRYKNDELKHLEENLYNIHPKKYLEDCKNIKLFLANNNYSEVEYVANNIVELVRDYGFRYRDISVITKNIEDYSSLIKAIFKKYEIPVFIDENKTLNQNILIKYILAFLDVFSKSWSLEAVCGYLKTGFINDISNDEIYKLENYCKKTGITGKKKFLNEWTIQTTREEDLEELNSIRLRLINPLKDFLESLENGKTVKDITCSLYKFIEDRKIYEMLNNKIAILMNSGEIDLANIYSSSYNLLIDILDDLVDVLGNEKISFEKYAEILKVGFNNSNLGKIPATLDEVIIGNVDRTRSSRKKVIFIIGLNDGKFPGTNKNEGFINDEERIILREKGLELAKTTIEQGLDENFNIYKAFGVAEEKIYLSYSASDSEGKGQRKSILVNRIKNIFPKLQEESDIITEKTYISSKDVMFDELLLQIRKHLNGEVIDDFWLDVYTMFNNDKEYAEKLKNAMQGIKYTNIPEDIKKENLEKLYGNELITSISKLESYRRCPFSYYLKYALKLTDKTELKLERVDTGTLMHDVIDDFFEVLKEKNVSVKDLKDEEIEKLLDEIINNRLSLRQNYIFSSIPKYVVLTKRLKKVITKAIKYIINTLKYSDFNVLGTEIEFGKNKEFDPIKIELEDGKSVEIIGKIDRIDIAENQKGRYVRIIDYKSSVKNIDLNEVMAGIQIQLLTYLDAVSKKEDASLAGTLYFNLIEPVIKSKNKHLTEEELEQEIRNNFKMNGLILGDVEVVKMMDKKLVTGPSDIIPATLDKEGNLNENKPNVLKKDEFKILQNKVEKIIKEISKEILSGKIAQYPIYLAKNKKTTCDFCEYKAICGFDSKMCNNKYNYVPNLKKEEILK